MNWQMDKQKIISKKLLMSSLAAFLVMPASITSAGTIVGSVHDMSGNGWSGGEICVVCHAPHNGDSTDGPLWNHEITTATHTTYTSNTMDGTPLGTEVTGTSKLCLSCHDGTVAVDSFGGVSGTSTLQNPNAILGTDLTNDHPISITYDDDLANLDGGLALPSSTNVTIGDTDQKSGTIADLLVPGGELQCSSCHDVHNKFAVAATPLLRISNVTTPSGLCLTCHTK